MSSSMPRDLVQVEAGGDVEVEEKARGENVEGTVGTSHEGKKGEKRKAGELGEEQQHEHERWRFLGGPARIAGEGKNSRCSWKKSEHDKVWRLIHKDGTVLSSGWGWHGADHAGPSALVRPELWDGALLRC